MKKSFILLMSLFTFIACAQEPGTVIEPCNHNGQFTLSYLSPEGLNTSHSLQKIAPENTFEF